MDDHARHLRREYSADVGVALLEANGTQAIVRLLLAEGLQSNVTPSDTSDDSAAHATPHVN